MSLAAKRRRPRSGEYLRVRDRLRLVPMNVEWRHGDAVCHAVWRGDHVWFEYDGRVYASLVEAAVDAADDLNEKILWDDATEFWEEIEAI